MARLIVIDASVAIAALQRSDAHHEVVRRSLAETIDDQLVVAATTRTEVLVGPLRAGNDAALRSARSFLAETITVPISEAIADAAAELRAAHPGLSVPDAVVLAIGRRIAADQVWTCDARWRAVDSAVVVL